jgi:hypothetical protein
LIPKEKEHLQKAAEQQLQLYQIIRKRTSTTMTVNVFSVPIFFVVFRESLETVVIVSVLLAFIKQSLDGSEKDAQLRKKLFWQVRTDCGSNFSSLLNV